MAGSARFAKGSGACAIQQPPRRLDMHALDHLVLEALGAAVECCRSGDGRGRSPPRSARRRAWQGAIWSGWMRLLPSKPSARPSRACGQQPLVVLQSVEHAVEGGDAGRPGREDDPLQRRRNGRPVFAGRNAEVGAQVVGARDQASRALRDLGRSDHPGGGLDHRQHRLATASRHDPPPTSPAGRRQNPPSSRATASRSASSPAGPHPIDADRDRHRPRLFAGLHRRRPRRILVRRLHRILEVEDDHVGARFPRLRDRARVGRGQEQQGPDLEKRCGHHRFSFPIGAKRLQCGRSIQGIYDEHVPYRPCRPGRSSS